MLVETSVILHHKSFTLSHLKMSLPSHLHSARESSQSLELGHFRNQCYGIRELSHCLPRWYPTGAQLPGLVAPFLIHSSLIMYLGKQQNLAQGLLPPGPWHPTELALAFAVVWENEPADGVFSQSLSLWFALLFSQPFLCFSVTLPFT